MDKPSQKIGILIGQLTQIGGVGIAAIEEARHLQALGYDVELVILKERRGFSHEEFLKDIPVRYLSKEIPWPLNISFKIPFFSFFSLFHITYPFLVPWVVKNKEYRCLIVHETYNVYAAITLKRLRGIPFYPVVWDPISYIMPRIYSQRFLRFLFPLLIPLGEFLDRIIINEAQTVLVGSRAHIPLLKKFNPKCRFEIIYSGCYPLSEIPSQRGDFILSLTKWDIGKNPYFLLEIMEHLRNQSIKLIMGGNWVQPSLKQDFLKKVGDSGLSDRITLTDWIDEEKKDKLFRSARLLIHPIFEAFGMFGLEAASRGCPLMIPKGSGVTELFVDGVHGFFPPEGDLESFVGSVSRLLGSERLAWQMGHSAWEVTKKYTWRDHAKKIESVILSDNI